MLAQFHLQDSSGTELLFWVIVGVIWAIGQIINHAKTRPKKQSPPTVRPAKRFPEQSVRRPAPPTPARPAPTRPRGGVPDLPEPLRTFFEQFQIEVDEEEEKISPPPRPITRERTPPLAAPAPMAVRETPTYLEIQDMDAIYAPIDDRIYHERVYEETAKTAQQKTITSWLIDPRTLIVDLHGLKMPLLTLSVPMVNTTVSHAPRPPLKNKTRFKQAIISQFILSPPLAMGEDKASFTERAI